ncbi:MAG: YraN family protein [Planctomycetaceae bacterium]|nr:YraN family protein [Planctomycetaceae bacterium]
MRGWLAKLLGNKGERAAARYLRQQGYKIIARNWSNHLGELDIIAQQKTMDGPVLVFVEVKTRKSTQSGHPHEAVGHHKQSQLTRVGLSYLKTHGLLNHRARFDVISILWPEDTKKPQIDHIQNAFEPPGRGQMYS